MTLAIAGIFAGVPEQCWDGKPPSAIRKKLVTGPMVVTENGLSDDAQADLSVHGGPEKALHYYAADHYPLWKSELGRSDLKPGSFGENLSATGLVETEVCIGDVFEIGSCTVQISQGRQPCWKLNAHTAEGRMAYLFQKTSRTGWYFRVLSTGCIETGDQIKRIDRPCPGWSVSTVTNARLSRKISLEDASILAELPELAQGWRDAFSKMAKGECYEDTSTRLGYTPLSRGLK